MGTGYTRNDTSNNIANGNVIDADDLDGEFNAIESAFNESTGHTHDGTSAEGAPITVTGPNQEYLSDGTALYPKTDDAYDLGKAAAEWRNLYVDGTANIDSLVADTADINGGTIDGTVIGGTTAAAITGTTITGTSLVGPLTGNVTGNVTGNLSGNVTSTGTSSFATVTVSGTVDGRDISVDGTKLDTIETNADVTDTANVTAAGALMDSELTDIASVKALDQGVATTDSPSFAGLTVDTDTLYVDSTLNRVGIGTTSPSAPLEVEGNFNPAIFINDTVGNTCDLVLADTNGSVRLRNGLGTFSLYAGGPANDVNATGSTLGFRVATNNDVSFWDATGSTAKLYWDASAESLGIGKTTPTTALDVNGTITATGWAGGTQAEAVWEAGTSTTESIVSPAKVAAAISALTAKEDLLIEHQETAGTGGGTSVSGDNTRTLNTVVFNNISGASLASNQITLPAGTYWIDAKLPAYAVNGHRARLYNVTDAANELLGTQGASHSSFLTQDDSIIRGRFTIASSKVFEIVHYTQTARATTGLGVQSVDSLGEIHAQVYIIKE